MFVNFNSSNYLSRSNLNISQPNFQGKVEIRNKKEILDEIKKIGELEPQKRANALNSIAIYLYNNPIAENGNELVETAILYLPKEDNERNALKYAVEILRLIKYAGCDSATTTKIQEMLRKAQTASPLDSCIKGFQPTSCNVCGQYLSSDEAQGYYAGKYPRRQGYFIKRKQL